MISLNQSEFWLVKKVNAGMKIIIENVYKTATKKKNAKMWRVSRTEQGSILKLFRKQHFSEALQNFSNCRNAFHTSLCLHSR